MKLNFFALLIFVLCVSMPAKPQHKSILSDSGSYCLWYDNVFLRDSVLLSFFLNNSSNELYLPSIPTSYEKLRQINKMILVPELVFRKLLNYNSVTHSLTESKKGTKIAKFIKNKVCYYYGQIKISKKFESHMFFLQHLNTNQIDLEENDDNQMIDDKLILVNLFNDTVTSVSCILSYLCGDGYLTYSQIDSIRQNDYLFFTSNGESDVVYPNNTNTYHKKDRIRFKFNDIGQIILLPL